MIEGVFLMTQVRRLGRGLEALLGRTSQGDASEKADVGAAVLGSLGKGLLELSVYQIDSNPFQPRKHIDKDELQQLAESIKEHGLLQPIVVRQQNDRYQIIVGERRLRAATLAGFELVPAQIRNVDDRQMAEMAIVENLQRKDLDPLEKAYAFHEYLQRWSCTQEELAGRLKINRSTVANLIRLLELPEPVQQAVHDGSITQGHARALLRLGEEGEQIEFAERIKTEELSVRAVEILVKETVRQADAEPLSVFSAEDNPPDARTQDANLASLEQEFRSSLGTKVDLKQSASGKGRIIIHFTSHDEFDRLRGQLTSLAGQPKREAA